MSTPSRLGSYVLLERLGRGGMAEVFFAAHTGAAGFQRPVVVKRMHDWLREDPGFVRMFVNEAKVAARLTHPNIVQIYDLGQADGELYIAMEFIHGRNLADLSRAHVERLGSPLPPELVAYVAREVAAGLCHAHRHRLADGTPTPIVHRDVSPHNIMVGYDGTVKLVDFGIAKPEADVGKETRTGDLKGKVGYMAPEQLDGKHPGPAADQWALGVVMHELLTGTRLVKARTIYDAVLLIKSSELPSPSASREVPPELEAVVMRALRRAPEERFPDLAAMQQAIDGWLGQRARAPELAARTALVYSEGERHPPDVSGMIDLVTGQTEAPSSLPRTPSTTLPVAPGVRHSPALLAALGIAAVCLLALTVTLALRLLRHDAAPGLTAPSGAAAIAAPPPSPAASGERSAPPPRPAAHEPAERDEAAARPPRPPRGKHASKTSLPVFDEPPPAPRSR